MSVKLLGINIEDELKFDKHLKHCFKMSVKLLGINIDDELQFDKHLKTLFQNVC